MLPILPRSFSRLFTRCIRRVNVASLLLLFSALSVLSLLLHAAHLLNAHVLPKGLDHSLLLAEGVGPDGDGRGLGEGEAFSLNKWLERAELERMQSGQRCIHPVLNPFAPIVMEHYRKETPVDCSANMEDWVYVSNGTFHISQEARRMYGKITCEYAPLVRGGDFSAKHGPHIKPMLDGAQLQTDFFKVACVSASGKKYMNVHSGVAWNTAVRDRLRKYHQKIRSSQDFRGSASSSASSSTSSSSLSQSPLTLPPAVNTSIRSQHLPFSQGLNLSVFMFGFDSLSRMAWLRLLPQTRKYFLEELGGIELTGYNIVGDGTPAALLPILTGKMEEELPEARRGFPGATTVDNHPWLWKDFSQRGYVTAHAEDMPHVGTFQYRMLGFKDQPTDHNMRTFYLTADRMFQYNPPLCLGSKPRHVNFMDWFKQLFDMYRDFPKFFFGFHSEMSHDYNNKVQAVDDDLMAFLKYLEMSGHLNNTLLVLMADHGARYDYMRATSQGKLEERMPYFSFRFPPWFKHKHPDIVRNLQVNSKRLTTPFDIHETFKHVLSYTENDVPANGTHRGISLLKEIPKERTCSHAHVAPHWCGCLEWVAVPLSDNRVARAVQTGVDFINNITKRHRAMCSFLSLAETTHASRYVPTRDDRYIVELNQKYLDSRNNPNGFTTPAPPNSNYSDTPTHVLYQVSFKTKPGLGHFEVTGLLQIESGKFSVRYKDISRINKYGSQPFCIQDVSPHLRPYCYCHLQ